MDKYRIVMPEIHALESSTALDSRLVTCVQTVIWEGDEYPEDAVIKSVTEGLALLQEDNNAHTLANGEEILIQARRNRLLGWRTREYVKITPRN